MGHLSTISVFLISAWFVWGCFDPGDFVPHEGPDPVAREAHNPRPSSIQEWGRLDCTKSVVAIVTELGPDGSADQVLAGLSPDCQEHMAGWQVDHLRQQYESRDKR